VLWAAHRRYDGRIGKQHGKHFAARHYFAGPVSHRPVLGIGGMELSTSLRTNSFWQAMAIKELIDAFTTSGRTAAWQQFQQEAGSW